MACALTLLGYPTPLPTHVDTQAPTLLTVMHKHMWGNSKLKYKIGNFIDQYVLG